MKSNQKGVGVIGAMVIVFAFACIVSSIMGNASHSQAAATPVATQEIKHETPKLNLMAIGVFGKTMDTLRDPKSLEIIGVYTYSNVKESVGCMEYRARNGFGGMNLGHSVWRLDKKFIIRFETNGSMWNKYCAGKDDYTDATEIVKKALKKINES